MFLFHHPILTFFSQLTQEPMKTSNVEHKKYVRNTSPFGIRDIFLILKGITRFHWEEIKGRDQEKSCFNQMKITKILVKDY